MTINKIHIDAHTINDLLFEIARTLDFKRRESEMPAAFLATATFYVVADREAEVFVPDIKLKSPEYTVIGGDWYEIPTHLLNLSKLIEADHNRVRSFAAQMSADGMLALQALGASGRLLGNWSLRYSLEDAARTDVATVEMLTDAGDISGIPPAIVDALKRLNAFLRQKIHPLAKGSIPIKFWNAQDSTVLCSALQYLPSYLLDAFDYDRNVLVVLPEGYRTAHTIFEALDQIENEGLKTAIENLGPDFCDQLTRELRLVGLASLGELFRAAWIKHPGDDADVVQFDELEAKIDETLNEDLLETLVLYFSGRADLFEARGS